MPVKLVIAGFRFPLHPEITNFVPLILVVVSQCLFYHVGSLGITYDTRRIYDFKDV